MGDVIEGRFPPRKRLTMPSKQSEGVVAPPIQLNALKEPENVEEEPLMLVPISVSQFAALVDALTFYGKQGFDHGKKAREVLSTFTIEEGIQS